MKWWPPKQQSGQNKSLILQVIFLFAILQVSPGSRLIGIPGPKHGEEHLSRRSRRHILDAMRALASDWHVATLCRACQAGCRLWGASVGAALAWWLVVATVRAEAPVLHEYIPNVDPHEAALAVSMRSGELPPIVYNGELILPPEAATLAEEVPVMGSSPSGPSAARVQNQPGRRSPTFRPDRITEFKASLSYFGSFTPAIAPFKRVTTLGKVELAGDGRTPVLTTSGLERRMVIMEGADAEAPDPRPRDRFWGHVFLDFSAGGIVPLPSVSPESRILVFDTRPHVQLNIEKDGDDNYYAVITGPVPGRAVELRFLTDAPRGYFAAPVPELVSTVLEAEVSKLPRSVQRRAARFAHELGLRRGDDLKTVIHGLTRHFRAFQESSKPPADTGDVYLDLARGKKGVCRHRSYAFVITAQALGVPARMVQNEAHAWVEVKFPGVGWMRIDLGGAASEVQAHAVLGRPAYQPVRPDSLPRPEAYERSYAQLRGDGATAEPLSREHLVGRWLPPDPAGGISPSRAQPGAGPARNGSGQGASRPSSRRALQISVDQKRVSVLRGKKMRATGRVLDETGTPVPGLQVELSLASERESGTLLLGITTTQAGGFFGVSLPVPADVPVGDYELIAVTPGNARFLPAMAP